MFVNLSTQRSRSARNPFESDILPVRPALYFYNTQGEPMAAESVVDLTGDLEVMEDGGLTVQTEMEPLGVLTISTHGQGELVSGSVRVAADGTIGGVLRFDLPGIGVAGVGVSSPVHDALFPVRRRAGGINTGVAIHNLGEEAIEVTCELMSAGAVLEEAEIPLEANGQSSWFIEEEFTRTDTSDFLGSVRCTAPGEGLFTGVAVELDAGNRIFTTLPVWCRWKRGRISNRRGPLRYWKMEAHAFLRSQSAHSPTPPKQEPHRNKPTTGGGEPLVGTGSFSVVLARPFSFGGRFVFGEIPTQRLIDRLRVQE